MTRQTIRLGKINGQESELTLTDYLLWLKTYSGKQSITLYNHDGRIFAMDHRADLYPIRDNEMLHDPEFRACILEHKNLIAYKLSARGIEGIPMQREDLLQVIKGQIRLSGEYSERLSQLEVPEELECAKQKVQGILERIAKSDFLYYENCDIRMLGEK